MRIVRSMLKIALITIIIYLCYVCLEKGAPYCLGKYEDTPFGKWYYNDFETAKVGQKVPYWEHAYYAGWACWDRSGRDN